LFTRILSLEDRAVGGQLPHPPETCAVPPRQGSYEWFEDLEPGAEHLDVSFVDRTLDHQGDSVVSTVKRVFRWKETGEIANTM
jgi:hypothetical protein